MPKQKHAPSTKCQKEHSREVLSRDRQSDGHFYQAGRDAVDMLLKNIIPFMAFISMLIGFINYTGVGDLLAQALAPFSDSIIGMLLIAFICSMPFLSLILGPGGVIAQVVGVLIGTQIGGTIPVAYALPALLLSMLKQVVISFRLVYPAKQNLKPCKSESQRSCIAGSLQVCLQY